MRIITTNNNNIKVIRKKCSFVLLYYYIKYTLKRLTLCTFSTAQLQSSYKTFLFIMLYAFPSLTENGAIHFKGFRLCHFTPKKYHMTARLMLKSMNNYCEKR